MMTATSMSGLGRVGSIPQVWATPGRISSGSRWLEKMASKESIAEARQRIQPTLAGRPSPWSDGSAHSLAGLIHDARNMVSAMDLYCDLLEEPGVLSPLPSLRGRIAPGERSRPAIAGKDGRG
jgi:hypothetical protein